MRTSLASGVALSVPTFFSGLIRAHGGGGGGGGETTTDPWGTTECTDQTTHETTWATTQPETTVETTAEPQKPSYFDFEITLWVVAAQGGIFTLSQHEAHASPFGYQSPGPMPAPEITLPGDPATGIPFIEAPSEGKHFLNKQDTYKQTANALKEGYPKIVFGPAVVAGTKGEPGGGPNFLHFFRCRVAYKWEYKED